MTKRKVEAASTFTRATCAVFGAGLTKTGALAIRHLVTNKTATSTMLRPMRISALNDKRIRKVAAGLGFSLFASQNILYGSGLNNFCQLAGPMNSEKGRHSEDYFIAPHRIPLPNSPIIVSIAAGRLHSLIGTSDGVYAFGDNNYGQCGQNPEKHRLVAITTQNKLLRVNVPMHSPCKQVHCTLDSSFVLLENGELYSFGLSADGQLGTGCTEIDWKPKRVDVNEPLKMVGGSGDTLVAVSKEGRLYIWGQVEYKQFWEFTDKPQIFKPQLARFDFNGAEVQSAAATNTSCIVTNKKGEVFTWGAMFLGFGPTLQESSKPVHLSSNLFADSRGRHGKVRRVMAGINTVAAINEADNLFIWGANRHGSLALGHDKDQLFPFQVFLPRSVQKLSLGPDHTLIITDTN